VRIAQYLWLFKVCVCVCVWGGGAGSCWVVGRQAAGWLQIFLIIIIEIIACCSSDSLHHGVFEWYGKDSFQLKTSCWADGLCYCSSSWNRYCRLCILFAMWNDSRMFEFELVVLTPSLLRIWRQTGCVPTHEQECWCDCAVTGATVFESLNSSGGPLPW